jgi:molecular chaperone GrpE
VSGSGGNGKDEDLPGQAAEAQPASSGEPGAAGEETGLQELAPSREQLEAVRRERDELKDALLRRRADLENFKKRAEREREFAVTEAATTVLRRLVETVDNLERALAAKGGEEALRRGVELTLRDFLTALESQGVTVVHPLGQPFDPERHQALVQEDVAGFDKGMVADVFRNGYLFKDRLLRPALVKVASGPPEEGEDAVDAGNDGEVQ